MASTVDNTNPFSLVEANVVMLDRRRGSEAVELWLFLAISRRLTLAQLTLKRCG